MNPLTKKPLVDLRKHAHFAKFYPAEIDESEFIESKKIKIRKQNVKERGSLSELKTRFVMNDYLTRTCLGTCGPPVDIKMTEDELNELKPWMLRYIKQQQQQIAKGKENKRYLRTF